MVWRFWVGFLLAIIMEAAPVSAAQSPAAEVTAALVEASKLMQKGGHAKAIEIIDTALKSGKVPTELAAKGLLMRAEANEKLGRTAFAYADYNSAIWMQGLSATDRKRAEEGHARVAKGLGIKPQTPSAGERAYASAEQGTAVQETPSEQRTGGTGGIGGFFNNLFTPNGQQQRPATEQAPATAVAVTAPPPAQPAVTAAKAPPPVVTGSVKLSDKGNFAIQLAAVADEEDKAIAEADRIAKKYKDALDGRTPSMMIVPTNDGGTLYKIVLAPFESRNEGVAACDTLKASGLSCMVIVKK